jgi:hypothetical protein
MRWRKMLSDRACGGARRIRCVTVSADKGPSRPADCGRLPRAIAVFGFNSMFSQLLSLFPRSEFEKAVRLHRADRATKGFDCWTQFVAMLFCQIGRAHSLREVCGGRARSNAKREDRPVRRALEVPRMDSCGRHPPRRHANARLQPWSAPPGYRIGAGQLERVCK